MTRRPPPATLFPSRRSSDLGRPMKYSSSSGVGIEAEQAWRATTSAPQAFAVRAASRQLAPVSQRSEEHTSELQSHSDLVCRLLLEKKKEDLQSTLLIKSMTN